MTKLSARIPSGENDGFAPIAQNLLTDPGTARLIIAHVDVSKITTSTDDGTSEATVRIRELEVVLPADFEDAEDIMRSARKERTGAYDLFDAEIIDAEDDPEDDEK